jgi:hypothetical protein
LWFCAQHAHGQVLPPGFQPKLGKQKDTPLVGAWRGVAKDGSQTQLDVEFHDEGLTVELVLLDPQGNVKQSGKAEKVRAFGGLASTSIQLAPARLGSSPKAQLNLEGEKLRLQVIDGIQRWTVFLTRLDSEGRPVPDKAGFPKAPGDNPEFTEVAAFKAGTQLLRYGGAAISPDGQLVAAAAPDIEHDVCIYDVAAGQEQRRLALVGPILCVRWSADGRTLVAGSGTNNEFQQGKGRQVGVWDTADWTQRALFEHFEHPISITLARDASIMAVAGFVNSSQAGTLTIWDTPGKTQTYSERKHQSRTNMAMSPSGDFLVASAFGGESQIAVFDLPSGKQRPLWKIKESLEVLAITPDGRGLAGASRNGTAYLYDLRSKRQTKTFPAYPSRPHCCTLLGGARYFALGGHKQGVQIFETRTGALAHQLLAGQSIHHLDRSVDGSHLLTYADDRIVRVWKTPYAAAAR